MSDWLLVVVPAAVGLVFVLYLFVGCSSFGESVSPSTPSPAPAPAPTPPYEAIVKAEAGLAAYWRLGDSTGTAVDQVGVTPALANGKHPGTFTPVGGGYPADDPQSSIAPPGTYDLGQPGLLEENPGKSTRFNGGFVNVPFDAALNPPKFTIEAWAKPTWTPETPPKYYAVITSRSDNAAGTDKRGYMLYAGPPFTPSPGTDPAKTYWQFWVGNGTGTWQMLIGPEVVLGATVYLVASCDGVQLKLWVDGGHEEAGAILPTVERTIAPSFTPNPSRPFFIAAGKTDKDPPAAPRYPFVGSVQDVAVYNVATIKVDTHGARGMGFTH